MMRSCFVVLILFGLIYPPVSHAKETRIALVIGIGQYGTKIGNLTNPPNDARLMTKTLRKVGFEVIERINVNQKKFKKAIKKFGNRLNAAGDNAVGLYYFAGHGVQVDGINYMIPSNADIEDEADVDIESVSADAIQKNMAYAGNRLNIIIMDACRNNPFKRGFRSVTRGLARMNATKGTLIAYATSPGDVAADGTGRNSPYTTALSKALVTPGLTVERMFKEVRNHVISATGSKQVPWESSSLTGEDYYFVPPDLSKRGKEGAPAITPEIVAWQSVQKSSSSDELDAFINSFPKSKFVALAKARLKLLKKTKVASLTPGSKKNEKKTRKTPQDIASKLLSYALKDARTVADKKENRKLLGHIAGLRYKLGQVSFANEILDELVVMVKTIKDPEVQAEAFYDIVFQLKSGGQFEKALWVTQQIAADHNKRNSSFNLITDELITRNRLEDALGMAYKVKGIEQRDKALNGIVQKLVQLGDLGDALAILNKMDEKSRRYSLSLVAQEIAKEGDIQGALLTIDAIREDARFFYMDDIARIQHAQGDVAGSHETMRTAVIYQDNNAKRETSWNGGNGYAHLAMAQVEIGDLDGAQRTIKKSLNATQEPWPRHNAATAMAMAGDLDGALGIVNEFKPSDTKDYAFSALSEVQAKKQDFAGALRLAARIADIDKRDQAFAAIAVFAGKAKNSEMASNAVLKIEKKYKRNSTYISLSGIWIEKGNVEQAIQIVERLPKGMRSTAMHYIVANYIKNAKLSEASNLVLNLVDPKKSGWLLYQLAEAYLKAGNIEKTTHLIDKISPEHEAKSSAIGLLVQHHLKKGDKSYVQNLSRGISSAYENDAIRRSQALALAESRLTSSALRSVNGIQQKAVRALTLIDLARIMIKHSKKGISSSVKK